MYGWYLVAPDAHMVDMQMLLRAGAATPAINRKTGATVAGLPEGASSSAAMLSIVLHNGQVTGGALYCLMEGTLMVPPKTAWRGWMTWASSSHVDCPVVAGTVE